MKFESNQEKKAIQENREKIISEYQKNYGGIYDAAFVQPQEVPQYFTQKFTYLAQGGESFLILGRVFKKRKKKQSLETIECEVYSISLTEVHDSRD